MLRRTLLAAGLLGFLVALAAPLAHSQPTEAALYKRLGGYDAIAAVVDEFIGRMAHDSQLGKFFDGHSVESLRRIRQLVVDQICAASGGPCYYSGRTMKASHEGLKITAADWDVAVKHLTGTLDKFKVGPKEREDLFALVGPLRADIVTAP